MGTEAHVVVVGGDEAGLTAWAQDRLADLEQRWSRFIPDSELSLLNQRPERPVVVSAETFLLVARSVEAWRATEGRFDPTVLNAVVACGYDRDLSLLVEGDTTRRPAKARPAPGCAGIRLDPVVGSVWLPAGAAIDPGGIGKGLAADLAVSGILDRGGRGATVNVGGDLAARGEAPGAGTWVVAIEHPLGPPGRDLLRLRLDRGGAVATSSRLRRRWRLDGTEYHHLVDPATGSSAPSLSTPASATVVAADAWWAEALATAYCVGAMPASVAQRKDASVILVGDDGRTVGTAELGPAAA